MGYNRANSSLKQDNKQILNGSEWLGIFQYH